MVYNLSILYFSLVAIFQLQLNNNVESRAFIMDDFKDYVKAQARPHENELQKYIKFLKASFTHGKASHLNAYDNLILDLFTHKNIDTKSINQTKNSDLMRLRPLLFKFKNQ